MLIISFHLIRIIIMMKILHQTYFNLQPNFRDSKHQFLGHSKFLLNH